MFLTEEQEERRDAIVRGRQPSELSIDELREIVGIIPEDATGLVQLAAKLITAHRYDEAEDHLWKAIEIQPCSWMLHKSLGHLYQYKEERDSALIGTLGSLEYMYLSYDVEACERMVRSGSLKQFEKVLKQLARSRKLSPAQQARFMSIALGPHGAENVPPRLLHQYMISALFAEDTVPRHFVDMVLREGEAIAPLLVGVLRGFAQGVHPFEPAVRSSIALLGEIADLSTLRSICEIDSILADSALTMWAFGRMKIKRGEAFTREVLEIAANPKGPETGPLMNAAIYYGRHWSASAQIPELLAAAAGRMEKLARNTMIRPLVMTLIKVKHREGVEMARRLLRENSSTLSREVRFECDAMIVDLSFRPFTNSPEPQERWETVYDYCCGSSQSQDEPEEDEDWELDDIPEPIEPVQRPERPGRNDPCWCGSGKKYKKCHLDADEHKSQDDAPAPPGGRMGRREFQQLQRAVIDFMRREISSSAERRDIDEALFGPDERRKDEVLQGEWTLHDWVSQRRGRTILEEYLLRNEAKLSAEEAEVLRNWIASYVGFYEVLEVQRGTGLKLRDLTSGETKFVFDVNLSRGAAERDGLLGRVEAGERGNEFAGYVEIVPRPFIDPLLAWMEKDKRRLRLPWNEYLKKRFPQIRRELARTMKAGLEALVIQNSDGEDIVFSTAHYHAGNVEQLGAALRGAAEAVEDESMQRYSWLSSDHTVLGNIVIAGEKAALLCNSRERLARGKEWLAALAGDSIEHLREEFVSYQELKQRVLEERRREDSET